MQVQILSSSPLKYKYLNKKVITIIGNPKYNVGDIVEFRYVNKVKQGVVAIVDEYGVWEDNSDVHYDILNKSENILYKHNKEDTIIKKLGEVADKDNIW